MNNNQTIVGAELPYFLPTLPFFLRMASSDFFVLADLLNFSSRSAMQRSKIVIQDDAKWLTVPVFSQKQSAISNVRIDYHENWSHKIIYRVKSAFHTFPYFEEFFPQFEEIIRKKNLLLFDLNSQLIRWFREIWHISAEIKLLSDFSKTLPDIDLPVFVCNSLGGSHYAVDNFNRPFVHFKQLRAAHINTVELQYEKYLPLELGLDPAVTTLDFLFKHGPQATVLFKEIHQLAKDKVICDEE